LKNICEERKRKQNTLIVKERERGERDKSVGENRYNENNFHHFIPTLTLKTDV
jgi:hypothetical protein